MSLFGDLFHITFKYLLEIISPIVGWCFQHWDINPKPFSHQLTRTNHKKKLDSLDIQTKIHHYIFITPQKKLVSILFHIPSIFSIHILPGPWVGPSWDPLRWWAARSAPPWPRSAAPRGRPPPRGRRAPRAAPPGCAAPPLLREAGGWLIYG